MSWAGFDCCFRHSPLLNIGLISRLDLLPALCQRVLAPPAVFRELTHSGDMPRVLDPASSWLTIAPANDESMIGRLREKLDMGEAEAIALALEKGADLLLMDERRGRHIAASLGLSVTGLLGVLAEAKRAGLVERVQPVLDDLIHRAGFWIGTELCPRALAEASEI